MIDGARKKSGVPSVVLKPRNSLTTIEIGAIVVLSALLHLGAWWLYEQSPLAEPEPMHKQASSPIMITLESPPKPTAKASVIDRHAVMPSKPTQPAPKPKPKPKPTSKPKPQPKPQPSPEPASNRMPAPKPRPLPRTATKTAPQSPSGQGTSNRITPAVSGLQGLNNPPPKYPARAVRRREEGVVELKILVEPDGTAGKVTVVKSSGHRALDKAAIEAVEQWKFKPARRGSTPIRGYALQSISFKLPD
jgi:protein TonB